MRGRIILTIILALAISPVSVGAADGGTLVLANGPATHTITYTDGEPILDGVQPCQGEGELALTFELTTGRFYGAMASQGCAAEVIGSPTAACCPVWDEVMEPDTCRETEAGAIDCSFERDQVSASILLEPDGTFHYDYVSERTGFHETIVGQLTVARVG